MWDITITRKVADTLIVGGCLVVWFGTKIGRYGLTVRVAEKGAVPKVRSIAYNKDLATVTAAMMEFMTKHYGDKDSWDQIVLSVRSDYAHAHPEAKPEEEGK